MKKWWWVFLLLCFSLNADPTNAPLKEIQQIDAQIQKLEIQKQKHIELARKYQAEGDQWEYRTGRIDEAHQAWAKADKERAQAIEYQRQIDVLLEQKDRIYQSHPELHSYSS